VIATSGHVYWQIRHCLELQFRLSLVDLLCCPVPLYNTHLVLVIVISPTMAAYFFASPIDVDIKLEGEEARKQVEMKGEKEKMISCPVYYDGDSVGGQVCLLCPLGICCNWHLTNCSCVWNTNR
jgi:hypothetical protein